MPRVHQRSIQDRKHKDGAPVSSTADTAGEPGFSRTALAEHHGSVRQVSVLGLGTFALGMDAYVTAGLLPSIGQDLSASISTTGQLATVFTLCYAVGASVFATMLANRSAHALLLSALAIFVAAN